MPFLSEGRELPNQHCHLNSDIPPPNIICYAFPIEVSRMDVHFYTVTIILCDQQRLIYPLLFNMCFILDSLVKVGGKLLQLENLCCHKF